MDTDDEHTQRAHTPSPENVEITFLRTVL